MALGSNVDVSDFLDGLARLEAGMAEDALVAAAMAGMLPVVNRAKETVHKVTGTLARSLHVEIVEKSRWRVVAAGGTDVEYAAVEEFGNSRRPGHPYLRPALDAESQRAVEEARAVLEQKLKAATK